MKLADVLWDAAHETLCTDANQWGLEYYSCCAVNEAIFRRAHIGCWGGSATLMAAREFLVRLGCPAHRTDLRLNASTTSERQWNRYMWLLLAMHVAEDEGIEI